jgi:hypothetical protein
MTAELRFIQVNLNKSKDALDLLLQSALRKDVDVILMTEQYKGAEIGNFFEDTTRRAGIMVPQLSVSSYEIGAAGFTWVEISEARIYSCYFSPNDKLAKFEQDLDILQSSFETARGEILITGDFNGKSPQWGDHRLDKRGIRIGQLLARWQFTVANSGNVPTFFRGEARSVIDLTFSTEGLARKIRDWQVLEAETLSDHQYIYFRLTESRECAVSRPFRRRWNVKRINWEKFEESLKCGRLIDELGWVEDPQSMDGLVRLAKNRIREAGDAAMPKRRSGHRGTDKYWWTVEIGKLRKDCVIARRRYTRSRGDRAYYEELKSTRRRLKKAIRDSQRRCWNDLIAELENDPWGLAYKIVYKKLRARQRIPELSNQDWVRQVIRSLFPRHLVTRVKKTRCEVGHDLLFRMDELSGQGRKLKNNKSPGPDGIPNEAIKVVIKTYPELLLKMYNCCLKEGAFYKGWKEQRLILLRKGKKPLDQPSSYRPLCLLDTMGKVLEGLILERLKDFVERKCPLSERQYGFRSGKSTIDAVRDVRDRAWEARRQGAYCALIGIDIRNAFNSLRWKDINWCLKKRKVPLYLRRMIRDYLSGRKIIFDGEDWVIVDDMTGGAPQGSRLGPFLWNIVYDALLKKRMPTGVVVIGFADDVIIVIIGDNIAALQIRMDESLRRLKRWLDSRGLDIAAQKTEAVLVTRRRAFQWPKLEIDGHEVAWKPTMTYLGVVMDRQLSFGAQVDSAALKGMDAARAMEKLMPNVRGPREKKRRLIAASMMSKIMYAAPAWQSAMDCDKYRKRLQSVQRLAALRIASAYRTVSTSAVLVLASMPPIDFLVRESGARYDQTRMVTDPAMLEGIRRMTREQTLRQWQCRWEREETGRWTYRIIPRLKDWIDREHGEVSFYLTQALTGHGSFKAYLHRFSLARDPYCEFCAEECEDDAEHTFFVCEHWTGAHELLNRELKTTVTPENMLSSMLSSKQAWTRITDYVTTILKEKEQVLRNITA